MTVFLDYETRSRCDIAFGGWRYIEDPSTEVLCGVAYDSETDTVHVWTPWRVRLHKWEHEWCENYAPIHWSDKAPEEIADADALFVGHNADGFDRLLWERLEEPEKRWADSLDRARRAALPGKLDSLGEYLFGLGKHGGGAAMKALASYKHEPNSLLLSKTIKYCIQDVLLTHEAWKEARLGDPHPDDPVLDAHREINRRGILVDIDAAKRLKAAAAKEMEKALEISPVPLKTLRSPTALTQWLKKRGVSVTDCQKATVDALLESELDDDVRDALTARRAVCRVTEGKLDAVINRVCSDGRLHGALAYYAAHTGRWGGRGFQPHNLPRPGRVKIVPDVYTDPEAIVPKLARDADTSDAHVLGAAVRGVIVAPKGCALVVVDLSQVEARGISWLAGDVDALRIWATADMYKVAATHIYGVREEEVTDAQRQVGKVSELALGFGGSSGAFDNLAKGYGVDIAELDTQEIVERWRDSRPLLAGTRKGKFRSDDGITHITRKGGLWKDLDAAVRAVILGAGPTECGRCSWEMHGVDLVCTLPSGRPMIYRDAKIESWETFFGKKLCPTYFDPRGFRTATYGGKISENCTQAMCRDFLGETLVRLERAGYRTVLHVHDEVVVEVDDDDAESALAHITKIMETVPQWAEGFPLKAEGSIKVRYGK